jgi:GT2 family glycosyltransferase
MHDRPRVLIALTVYNGRSVVPATMASLAHLEQNNCAIDVLVLDDCSPEPGWSDEVATLAAHHGFEYYRTPRNLGIPRNVNLGLLTAKERRYEFVIISNSDVVYAANAVDTMARAAVKEPRLGAITACSTNVSIYSIPNSDPDRWMADQQRADLVGTAMAAEFGTELLDIPAGISFAMLIPVRALDTIGLMDPVFGRGYCEETDWSQRCRLAGLRLTLGLGAFVYHAGGGSNLAAGVLAAGHTTVPANERIIDLRYPQFRADVGDFLGSGVMADAHRRMLDTIVRAGIDTHGYDVAIGPLIPRRDAVAHLQLVVHGETVTATAIYGGFASVRQLPRVDVGAALAAWLGAGPSAVEVYDIGAAATQLAHEIANDAPVYQRRNYPTAV